MAVWWVFQGDSYERSRKGGYLWAPLLDKRGHKKSHWESVDQVKKGDLVLSSKDRKLVAISIAKTDAYRAPQPDPEDAKLWEFNGRKVDVAYTDIDNPLAVDDLLDIFSKYPNEQGPLDLNGKGKMGYLFPLHPGLAQLVLEKLDAINDVDQLISSGLASEKSGPAFTTVEKLQQIRVGQNKFRENLLKNYGNSCALTGVNQTDLLIASHIKPWRLSNDSERLDPANGILLEAGLDKLFDKGFISFDDTGLIMISTQLGEFNADALGLNKDMKLRALRLDSHQYLEFHRTVIYKT